MRKLLYLVATLMLIVVAMPAQAQEGSDTRALITPDNAFKLTIVADLPTVDNNNLSWSPDARYLASELPTEGGVSIVLWDTDTWQQYRVFDGHSGDIWFLHWSPDGNYLASSTPDDNAVRIWDVENGTLYREFEHDSVSRPSWSPDGKLLSTTGFDEQLRVWDVETGEIVLEVPASGGETSACTVWSPNQRWLGAGILDEGEILLRIWDIETWQVQVDFAPARLGGCPIWSADGQTIATLAQGMVLVYDVEAGMAVHEISQLNTSFFELEWSSDNSLMATGADGGHIMLWDVIADEFAIPFRVIPEPVEGLHSWEIRLSPNADLLAVSTVDTIKLWDTTLGDVVMTLRGHSPDIVRLEWSPDGTFLASTDRTGQVLVWGIATD